MFLVPPGPQLLSFICGPCSCLGSASHGPQREKWRWLRPGHEDRGAKEGEKMRIKEEIGKKLGIAEKEKKILFTSQRT